jgi:nitrogenase molybdenum-iron protein alpha/beta subunit
VEPEDVYLNVVDDNFISFNKGDNRKHLSSLLSEIGMVLGPGFLNDCSVDDIRNLRRYGMSVLCESSRDNLATKGILESKEIEFMGNSRPRGYSETLEWMRELMSLKGKGSNILERISEEYDGCVSRYSKDLSGRRIDILSWDPRKDAWIADALSDCGCDVIIHTLGASDSRDRRITVHGSMEDLTNSVGPSDAVIDCMSTDIAGTMEKPDTWLSHRASMELIRRVWSFVMSKGEGSWAAWGD